MKRVIAVLSAVVLLFTINTTKKTADTLERIPTCGVEEHVHTDACFDVDGNLICGFVEHVHTDACYQERPKSVDTFEPPVEEYQIELSDADQADNVLSARTEAGSEANAMSMDIDAPVEELGELELEDINGEDNIAMPSDESEVFPESEESQGYIVGAQNPCYLSDIIADQGLNIAIDDVVEIGQAIENDDDPILFNFELVDGDIALYVKEDFERAELVITTEDALHVVELMFGIAPIEETGADAREAEVSADEPADVSLGDIDQEQAIEGEEREEGLAEATGDAVQDGDVEDDQLISEPTEDEAELLDEFAEDIQVEQDAGKDDETAEQADESTEEIADAKESADEQGDAVAADETEGEAEGEQTDETEEEAEDEKSDESKAEETEAAENEQADETEGEETEEETEDEKSDESKDEETEEETEDEKSGESKDEETEDEKSDAADGEEIKEGAEDEQTGEAQGDETEAPDDGAQPVPPEVVYAYYEATIDLADVEVYPIALTDLMARATWLGVEETVPAADVEGAAAAEPVSEPVETEPAEADALEEDIPDEGTAEMVEAEAVDPVQSEAAFELDGEEIVEPEVPEVPESDAWVMDYDASVLSVERDGDDYALSILNSFEQTTLTVDNGEQYRITLLNGAAPVLYPAAAFAASTEYVTVSVEAPEGAFPAGTTMVVRDVDDEDTLHGISDKVEEGFVRVERVHAVDITFLNADGEEIEPLIPISVVMTVREIEEEKERLVVHVDHEGEAQLVDNTESTTTEVSEQNSVVEAADESSAEAGTAVAFTAESFSVYAVVVGEKLETKVIAADGNTYRIEVTYTEDAGIPSGATLDVSEVTGDESYRALVEESLAENKRVTLARFFDIRIMNGAEVIQPAVPVTVKIELISDENQDAEAVPCAVHFAEDEVQVIDATEEDEAVSFRAESFSVWGVVYTVDFHYVIDGEEFAYILPGGGFVRLSDLVRILGLAGEDADEALNGAEDQADDGNEPGETEIYATDIEDAVEEAGEITFGHDDEAEDADEADAAALDGQVRRFLEAVDAVTFSNPELVWTGRVEADTTIGALKAQNELKPQYSVNMSLAEVRKSDSQAILTGDWALISLLPFDTEETLTINMKNGEAFTILVTDAQLKQTVVSARGETYEITVTYGEDAMIPDGAELRVEEIEQDSEAYADYLRKAIAKANGAADDEDDAAVQPISESEDEAADLPVYEDDIGELDRYARFFDIEIWSGGEKIEPAAEVFVNIKLMDAPEDETGLKVVHFGVNGPEIMDTADGTPAQGLSFVTDEFSVYAVISENSSNGYGLGGKKFAIVNNASNEAVLAQENGQGRLAASSVIIKNNDGQYYAAADEIDLWEFVRVNNNIYNIKAPNGQYMNISGRGTAGLSSTPQNITVSSDSGMLRLTARVNSTTYALNAWNNTVSDGFGGGTYGGAPERFTLYSVAIRDQDQADKISLTDLVNVHTTQNPINGVIIYTRIENDDKDGYDYYAVTSDGSLVPVYDLGDVIGWTTSDADSDYLKWKLTVHITEGDANGYFDFQSVETGNYLIPTANGGIKADDPSDAWDLGVNLPGWKADGTGTYDSSIERWDNGTNHYVGYAYDAANKKIVPTTDDSQKLEFLFAYDRVDPTPDQLHTVATLDGKSKGITIRMYDFDGSHRTSFGLPRSWEMTDVLGTNSQASTNENGVGYANRGLVSETLTNGFPTATETNKSLGQLFNDAHLKSEASNIFVRQVYDETGYFSYDSSINYAWLDQANDQFVLYRELAAPAMEGDNTPSGNKGNFFPFVSLQDLANRNYVFDNRFVQYDGDLQRMTADNPLYGQKLYRINNDNNYSCYYFGMTMEADFYQGKNGKDERGNDIIYEFNGDDDMWLYIDDRLVLDIGGCHGAVSGTINFATGQVKVNGAKNTVTTTLRQIFQNAGELPDGSPWTEEGASKWFRGNTFADYTTHSFKMFYMERGAYASNLKMRFNLMTIEPGTLVLEKKLPEDVQIYGEQSFAYQIYTVSGGHQTLYTPPEGKVVTYEKTGEAIPIDQAGDRGFKSNYTIDNTTYQNVYLLKPYEPIVIPMVSDDVEYFIREIGIPDVYKEVKANDQNLTITGDRMADTDVETVKIRGRVTYENIPETHNLRLEKLVQGPILNENDSFRFDVQLEDSETGSLVPFNRGEYYVVKTNDAGVDQYYKYSDGQLVPSTEPVAYKAGPNGSIAQIYPGYTILIKGLLPGTDFKVTENMSSGEYPVGYSYVKKEVSNEAEAQIQGADGRIPAQDELEGDDKDALVQITNTSRTDITLIKVDRDDLNKDNPNLLKGASFTLSKYTDEEFTVKDVSWGTEGSGSVTLSDERKSDGTYPLNGVFTFKGLTVGCYQLEEISFPDGYVKLSGNPTFKIEANASNGLQITLINNPDNLLRLKDDQLTLVVGNTPGAVLPATGGPGTRLYTLSGIGLMALAAFMLLRKRARNTL